MPDYETWLEDNYEELGIMAAETGADREINFDWDRFTEAQYDQYIKRQENKQCLA